MLRYSTYRSIYDNPVREEVSSDKPLLDVICNFAKSRAGKTMVILMIFIMGWTGAFSVVAGGMDKPKGEKHVIVQPGDSLWSIASSHKPRDMDTRDYVSSISENNDLSGPEIQAGDVLALPLW